MSDSRQRSRTMSREVGIVSGTGSSDWMSKEQKRFSNYELVRRQEEEEEEDVVVGHSEDEAMIEDTAVENSTIENTTTTTTTTTHIDETNTATDEENISESSPQSQPQTQPLEQPQPQSQPQPQPLAATNKKGEDNKQPVGVGIIHEKSPVKEGQTKNGSAKSDGDDTDDDETDEEDNGKVTTCMKNGLFWFWA